MGRQEIQDLLLQVGEVGAQAQSEGRNGESAIFDKVWDRVQGGYRLEDAVGGSVEQIGCHCRYQPSSSLRFEVLGEVDPQSRSGCRMLQTGHFTSRNHTIASERLPGVRQRPRQLFNVHHAATGGYEHRSRRVCRP
jgi:hypothetical protein